MIVKLFSSIVESNGKTIKESNMQKNHKIPIGSLVEDTETGIRAFVALHTRDCDGTPLYSLTIHEVREQSEYFDIESGIFRRFELLNGLPEENLDVIRQGKSK